MISLTNNKGFSWHIVGDVTFKGYIYDSDNNLLDIFKSNMVQSNFQSIRNENEFICFLQRINGNYAIIVENENYIFAAVDRVRSIPLFYSKCDNEILLSDDAYYIRDQLEDLAIDELSINEFNLTGYVTGNDTLYKNIKQIGAGEALIFDKRSKELKINRYFELRHNDFTIKSDKLLIEDLDKVYKSIMSRVIKSLNGRTAVIPLSGGQDSRLIAIMFKKLGYENVICYTYGVKGNIESSISKKVADYLGYRWYFVEYSRKSWYDWYNSYEYEEYKKYASNLSSEPHFQDLLAVKELKSLKLIPNDSVFIPGHAADFIQGSHIPEWYLDKEIINRDEILESIFKRHYNKWRWKIEDKNAKEIFIEKMESIVGKIGEEDRETAADIFECWDWKERQSKFIVNSVRVYEFLGYEYRLPFWDIELIEYWQRIDIYNRVNRKLHYKYVKSTQEKLLNDLNLSLPSQNNISLKNKMKNKLKKECLWLYNILLELAILKNKISGYYNDPLQWFGIVSWLNYAKSITKFTNIDSFIIHDYLLDLKKDKRMADR